MRLYNTLTRTEETFTPSKGNVVRMYACGLTVYSRGHIGNFRSFVAGDILRRTLRYLEHFEVRHVVNFTDVDDRTIAGSQKAGKPLREYTTQWVDAFLEDSRALGLEAEIGSLEAGKRADIAVFDLDKPYVGVLHRPLTSFLTAGKGSDVRAVLVDGRVVYRRGEFAQLAEPRRVIAEAEKIGRAIIDAAGLGHRLVPAWRM